ncbi:MAG: LCP family protein [Anaerolineales bacterium]
MTKRNAILLFLGIIIIGGLIFGIVVIQKWNQPLGESLALATKTSTVESDQAASDVSTGVTATAFQPAETNSDEQSNPGPTTIPTTTAVPTATPEPLCGGPATMTVLALGVDSGGDNDYLYGLADVIKIARIDFVTPRVSVISLPRDLWVQIPGIEDFGVTEGKLNQSYFYGTKGMGYYDGPGGAPGLMARTLQENFGLTVDHYGTVNMVTFKKMVDAVGGIDVYLPTDVDGRPVDDHTEDMGYFYAGNNHFNGDAALRFSRIRKTDTIFARMDRQKMVICALKDKLLQPSVIGDIPELIASFQGSIVTDLSPAQMSQMACLLPKLSDENIIFGGIPQEELTMSRQWDARQGYYTFVWAIENNVVRDYIERFEEGTWPVSEGSSGSCPPPVQVGQ